MNKSLLDIINETHYETYSGYIRVTFTDDVGITELAELFRALPGVTTIHPIEGNKTANQEIYKVKIITQRGGEEAFEKLKENALNQYKEVRRVEIAKQSITKRD